jgi:hypothetical protein
MYAYIGSLPMATTVLPVKHMYAEAIVRRLALRSSLSLRVKLIKKSSLVD